jgi:DUF4097 and DUF4098 domain-containing protein YvlB
VQIKMIVKVVLSSLALVACVTATAQAQRDYGESLDTTVTLDRQATVDLSLMSGRIDVVGGSGSQARVRATSNSGDIRFDATGGRLRLSVDPGRRRCRDDYKTHCSSGTGDARFEVTVPIGTRVLANSISGPISVRGAKGEADANSVSGSVTVVDAARKVKAASVSGNVSVSQVAGDVRASSVSGRVEVIDVAGDIETESVSGRISITGARSKYVRAGSVSGRIAYGGTFDPSGTYEFKTHSGSLWLSLPADVGAQVRIETFSGGIDSDFPVTLQPTERGRSSTRNIEFKIGDGRSRIVAETFSGQIKIQRGDGRDTRD